MQDNCSATYTLWELTINGFKYTGKRLSNIFEFKRGHEVLIANDTSNGVFSVHTVYDERNPNETRNYFETIPDWAMTCPALVADFQSYMKTGIMPYKPADGTRTQLTREG